MASPLSAETYMGGEIPHGRRKQKYFAARAFFITILLVTSIAAVSTIADWRNRQGSSSAVIRARGLEDYTIGSSTATSQLERRDEAVCTTLVLRSKTPLG